MPTIRTSGGNATTAAATCSATTNGTPVVGDTILVLQGQDWDAISTITAPTVGGTWAEIGSGWDAGAFNPGMRMWTRPVTVAGAQTITVNGVNGDWIAFSYIVFAGAVTFSTPGGTPTTGSATTGVAPSVLAGTAADTLVSGCITLTFSGSTTVGTPSGMTSADTRANGTTSGWRVATQALAASGATGTRSFSLGTAANGNVAAQVSVSDAVAPPSGPEPGRMLLAA